MRYLSIFTLLVASSSLASASFITGNCVPTPGIGASGFFTNGGGTVSYNCNGANVAPGFQIIAGSLTLVADYTGGGNGFNQFTVSIASTGFTPNPLTATSTGTGINSAVAGSNTATLNGTPFANGVSLASFVVTGTGSLQSGSVDAGIGRLSYSYTVEAVPNTGGVPEPSTLALVGGVLVLAGLRKFKS